MALPSGRPASDCYQPAACVAGEPVQVVEDEDDGTPIFSLSKSSIDVLMAAGPAHKHDPVWTPVDLRRSCSTNTHSDNGTAALKQRHQNIWQRMSEVGVHKADVHSPPVLSHVQQQQQRWSQCSSGGGGSAHSRSSTPDTVVWRDDLSRPSSLTLETLYPAAPDSPRTKLPSPPAELSPPLSSPLLSPNLPPEDLLTFTSSPQRRGPHQPRVSAASSPISSPQQTSVTSPFTFSSTNIPQLPDAEYDIQENNHLSFTFSSPALSSASLAEGGGDSGRLSQVIRELQLLEDESSRCPGLATKSLHPCSPTEGTESAVCLLELPWQPEPSCLTSKSWRSPLVASMSDSHLADCCHCCCDSRDFRRSHRAQTFREEGTMTVQPEMVDTAVQTLSPIDSLWGLKRNISNSNMGSHSLLGSPPGSKLNLKSSVGSNSNLVSPSSSMFRGSSGEEEEELGKEVEDHEEKSSDEQTEQNSAHQERRRSCLKTQGEEKDEYVRRSSMKQVQWDEDGMTWDVHGASPEPEVLKSAIQRHLEVQGSPRLAESASKKKKRAPLPPLLTSEVKPRGQAPQPPSAVSAVEGTEEGGAPGETDGGGSRTETPEAARRISRAEEEAAAVKDDEVYGEESTSSSPRPPSRASTLVRKKSVIRLRRPVWCGGSRKTT